MLALQKQEKNQQENLSDRTGKAAPGAPGLLLLDKAGWLFLRSREQGKARRDQSDQSGRMPICKPSRKCTRQQSRALKLGWNNAPKCWSNTKPAAAEVYAGGGVTCAKCLYGRGTEGTEVPFHLDFHASLSPVGHPNLWETFQWWWGDQKTIKHQKMIEGQDSGGPEPEGQEGREGCR